VIFVVKLKVAAAFLGVQIALLELWTEAPLRTIASVPAAALGLCVSLALMLLTCFEHIKSTKPSSLISTYLLFSLVFDAAQTRTLFLRGGQPSLAAVSTTSTAIKVAMLILESKSKRAYLKPKCDFQLWARGYEWNTKLEPTLVVEYIVC